MLINIIKMDPAISIFSYRKLLFISSTKTSKRNFQQNEFSINTQQEKKRKKEIVQIHVRRLYSRPRKKTNKQTNKHTRDIAVN